MTLTPSRPVPEASSEEQQRLEVELLVGEPVLQATELQALGQDLLFTGKGLPEARWRELGALPLQESKGRLVVAVPSNWGPQQRQNLSEELQRAGFNAELKLALATNLATALTPKAPTPAPGASRPPTHQNPHNNGRSNVARPPAAMKARGRTRHLATATTTTGTASNVTP